MNILAKSSFFMLRFIAAGLGSGWLPKAPGTWGSLASLLPAWWILTYAGVMVLWIATLVVSIVGFMVCYFLLPKLVALGEHHDPGWIVIDEWAGQWLCMAIIFSVFPALEMMILLPLAFVLFRSFDILKPFPIKHVESWGADWFSIMHDDLVAGVLSAVVGLIVLTMWL